MLNPDDIHREAEKERRKQEARRKKKRRKKRGDSFTPQPADSRYVFHRIYPHQPDFRIWVLLPLVLATIGFMLWLLARKQFGFLWPYVIALAAVPAGVWCINFIRERIDYQAYQNWRSSLGFTVNGWDRLGESPHFPHWKHWDRSVTVMLQLKPTASPEDIRLLEDLLYLFTRKANQTFYAADQVQPGAAGDLRNSWQRTGELEVSGSANGSVMGEIYLLLHRQLRMLQKQTPCILAVVIRYSRSMLEVEPMQVSD